MTKSQRSMTQLDRVLLHLGLHRCERNGPASYTFGVVIAHCRCGHDFSMPYMPRDNT